MAEKEEIIISADGAGASKNIGSVSNSLGEMTKAASAASAQMAASTRGMQVALSQLASLTKGSVSSMQSNFSSMSRFMSQSMKINSTIMATMGAQMKAQAQMMPTMMSAMRTGFRNIAADVRPATTAVAQFNNGLTEMQRATNHAVVATAALGYGLAKGIGGALKEAGQYESTRVAYDVMLGSAKEGKKMIDEITTFAAETPFEFPELAQSARTLMSFGISADEVIDRLRQIGDVSAGVQQPIAEIALWYGKIKSTGKIMGDDLNRLADRGIPLVSMLAEKYGVSEMEIRKYVESGKVGFADLEEVFEKLTGQGGRFNDMMVKQSQTLNGLMSTLRDYISLALRKVGIPIADEMKPVIKDVIAILGEMEPQFIKIGQSVGKMAKDLMESFKSAMQWIQENGNAIAGVIQQYGAFAVKALALAVALKVVIGIGGTLTSIFRAIFSVSAGAFRSIGMLNSSLRTHGNAFNVATAAMQRWVNGARGAEAQAARLSTSVQTANAKMAASSSVGAGGSIPVRGFRRYATASMAAGVAGGLYGNTMAETNLGSQVAQVSSLVGALASFTGPMGMAIGGLIGAVGGLFVMFENWRTEGERTKEEAAAKIKEAETKQAGDLLSTMTSSIGKVSGELATGKYAMEDLPKLREHFTNLDAQLRQESEKYKAAGKGNEFEEVRRKLDLFLGNTIVSDSTGKEKAKSIDDLWQAGEMARYDKAVATQAGLREKQKTTLERNIDNIERMKSSQSDLLSDTGRMIKSEERRQGLLDKSVALMQEMSKAESNIDQRERTMFKVGEGDITSSADILKLVEKVQESGDTDVLGSKNMKDLMELYELIVGLEKERSQAMKEGEKLQEEEAKRLERIKEYRMQDAVLQAKAAGAHPQQIRDLEDNVKALSIARKLVEDKMYKTPEAAKKAAFQQIELERQGQLQEAIQQATENYKTPLSSEQLSMGFRDALAGDITKYGEMPKTIMEPTAFEGIGNIQEKQVDLQTATNDLLTQILSATAAAANAAKERSFTTWQ